jgi:hypothetical protein
MFFYFSSVESSQFFNFINGNITTSLRFSCSVNIANILSNHIPNHDCGGIQYSIASTNASSQLVASSSHFSAASACLSKFAC